MAVKTERERVQFRWWPGSHSRVQQFFNRIFITAEQGQLEELCGISCLGEGSLSVRTCSLAATMCARFCEQPRSACASSSTATADTVVATASTWWDQTISPEPRTSRSPHSPPVEALPTPAPIVPLLPTGTVTAPRPGEFWLPLIL